MLPNFLLFRLASMMVGGPLVYLAGVRLGLSSALLAGVLLMLAANATYVLMLALWRLEAFRQLHPGAVALQTLAAGAGLGLGLEVAHGLGGPGRFSSALAAAVVFVAITGGAEALLRRWLQARPAPI